MVAAESPEYKSFGTFAPVYTSAIEQIYDTQYLDRARHVEKVLRALAEHADCFGLCYPGIDRLRERTHYAETTIRRALLILDELDYVRVHVEYVASRRKEIITYQVSPFVLWITKDHIDDAMNLWLSATKRLNEIIQGQPTPESESEPATDPTTEPAPNHHHHPGRGDAKRPRRAANASTKQTKTAPAQRANETNEDQRAAQEDSAQRSTQRRTPPPAPPLSACRAPLPNPDDEALAARLAAEVMTRDAQARQLVQQYGAVLVDQALAWLQVELKAGNVQKPAGLLNWWLKESVLTGKPPQPRQQSLTAGYEGFFER